MRPCIADARTVVFDGSHHYSALGPVFFIGCFLPLVWHDLYIFVILLVSSIHSIFRSAVCFFATYAILSLSFSWFALSSNISRYFFIDFGFLLVISLVFSSSNSLCFDRCSTCYSNYRSLLLRCHKSCWVLSHSFPFESMRLLFSTPTN